MEEDVNFYTPYMLHVVLRQYEDVAIDLHACPYIDRATYRATFAYNSVLET
jgi:hypothetical protein